MHLTRVDLFKVKSLWGNYQFEFATSSSQGRSGGLLSIWDPGVFKKVRVISNGKCVDCTWRTNFFF